ncbi:hypothetical protein BCLUESOX_1465 [bacterium endosymbiont of Bathymodiolus sp. 5 South]|nr:hypothetical protein BCLUESOX_1465 [bacterium endosymbiont of Bathymodiolus sp. 5 South]VVH61883.1 hypothetical protein BSPWISOX_1003 [uncultured Gammaproteobacteria bacterium]
MGLAFGYFNERVESYFYDKRVAFHFFFSPKRNATNPSNNPTQQYNFQLIDTMNPCLLAESSGCVFECLCY